MNPTLMQSYRQCPMCCGNNFTFLRVDPCNHHPLWQQDLPAELKWMFCPDCQHVFTDQYFTDAGLGVLFGKANSEQVAGGDLDRERMRWAPTVERVQRQMPEAAWMVDSAVWVDIGCGSGGLLMTASEYGFDAIGVDTRQVAVDHIVALGYKGAIGDLREFSVSDPVQVVSLADVLEHVPFPRDALKRVHAALQSDGFLVVSCPNLDCSSWRKSTADLINPYWGEIEHHHNFSRASLMRLLAEEGFIPIEYAVSSRYKSCMEVLARRL